MLAALCNDPMTLAFLRSASFKSAKRPITKALLQRIDLLAILRRSDRRALQARARDICKREIGIASGTAIPREIERLEQEFARLTGRARAGSHPVPHR